MKDLLYDYYKLIDKDTSNVSKFWLGFQITFLLASVVFSTVEASFMYFIIHSCDMNCIMSPRIIMFKNESITPLNISENNLNNDLHLDFINSQWADASSCFFAYFNPILSIIFGIVWVTFFVMFSGLTSPWRLVVPALVFCFGYMIMCSVVYVSVQHGLGEFVDMFKIAAVNQNYINDYNIQQIIVFIALALAASWLNTVCWALSSGLLILRFLLIADFDMVRVKVELIKIKPQSTAPIASSEQLSPEITSLKSHQSIKLPSPIIKKHTDSKPKIKKIVSLMDPVDIVESSIDLPEDEFNSLIVKADVEPTETKSQNPFTRFDFDSDDKDGKDQEKKSKKNT